MANECLAKRKTNIDFKFVIPAAEPESSNFFMKGEEEMMSSSPPLPSDIPHYL